MRTRGWLAGLVVLSLVAAACGGDDDDVEGSSGADNVLRVVEREYGYEISGEVQAGTVTVAFENAGDELHMLTLCRTKGDATVTDIADAAQTQDESALDEVCEEQAALEAAAGIQAPGAEYEVTVTDVDAGRYVAMCFLPDPEGTPHIALGMAAEFEVAEGDAGSEPEADVTYVADADGTEGPEELEAGSTTFQVEVEDASREVVLLKLKEGSTPSDVDDYFRQIDEGAVYDPEESPAEFLLLGFDWEYTRWFTVDLTEGQWGIGLTDPEQEEELPAEEDPHVVLFEVT